MTKHDDDRAVNVAEAKRQLSELVGRVAFGGETVIITRRGRPMAKLVPIDGDDQGHLTDVKGWLQEDDPFFAAVGAAVAARVRHRPRVLAVPRKTSKKKA